MQTFSPDRINIYHALFSHYLDPSLVVDPETGEIVECNLAAIRFLRLKRNQVLGHSLAILQYFLIASPMISKFRSTACRSVRSVPKTETVLP